MEFEHAAVDEAKASLLHWFLMNSSGPLVLSLIGLGTILTIWGLANVFFVRNPILLILQALLSFVPGLISVVGALYAFAGFAQLASSASPAPPSVYGQVVAAGIACGVWGPVVTFVAGALGVLALGKIAFRAAKTPRDADAGKPLPA